jgi:transcriptional regulator with XRE-family HTH domain
VLFYNKKAKQIRKDKKLPLISVAKMSGITRGTLWLWEKGDIVPAPSKVRQLSRTLKIPVPLATIKNGLHRQL